MPAITPQTYNDQLLAKVPMAVALQIRAESIRKGEATLIMPFGPQMIRPVGVVSGPALMTLADVGMWAAILSLAGPLEMVVTTNLNVNFLRMAQDTDMIGEARVLKMGRRLAVSSIDLIAAKSGDLVAHASGSFAIPPAA